MKKNLLSATLLSTALLLSACTADTAETTTVTTSQDTTTEKLSIVASSAYQYDWMCEILGEEQGNFELTLLMDNGVDLHSYEPSVADISLISSADMFIYTGGTSDTWVDDIIAQPMNEDLMAISMTEILNDRVLMEVTVEGMEETEHDHDHDDEETTDDHDHDDEEVTDDHDHDDEEAADDHDHDHDEEEATDDHDHDHDDEEVTDDHDHDHDDEEEATDDHDHDHDDEEDATDDHDHDHDDEDAHEDEHVWLSLENAMMICDALADELGQLDSEHAETYRANGDAYIATLRALADDYETMVSEAARDTVLFGDRFPFLYLMNDYGIEYYAAFQGCSAETEASFETILFLTEKVNELGLNYIFVIDNGLESLATTIIANSQNPDCEILVLDSMQSTSKVDIEAGSNYYSIMEENLEILALALGE